jgi:hypothetical protein
MIIFSDEIPFYVVATKLTRAYWEMHRQDTVVLTRQGHGGHWYRPYTSQYWFPTPRPTHTHSKAAPWLHLSIKPGNTNSESQSKLNHKYYKKSLSGNKTTTTPK